MTSVAKCVVCGEPGRSSHPKTTCAKTECIRHRKRQYDRERYPLIATEVRHRAALWQAENADLKQDYDKQYRSDNAEKVILARRAWTQHRTRTRPDYSRLASARRRARKLENGVYQVTEHDVQRLVTRYRGLCAYCLTAPYKHLDHVFPIARGGSHGIGNLLPACQPCNQAKNHRTIMEWQMGKSARRDRP